MRSRKLTIIVYEDDASVDEDENNSDTDSVLDPPIDDEVARDFVMNAINKSLSFNPPKDGEELVHPQSTLTKRQLAKLLTNLQGCHSLTKACLKDILSVMSSIFPDCSLPKLSRYACGSCIVFNFTISEIFIHYLS